MAVTLVPPSTSVGNWANSDAFNVAQLSLPLSQYLSTPISAYDDCVNLTPQLCPGKAVNPALLPTANLYVITPPNLISPNESQFTSALSTFFGINIPNYDPVAVVILQLPAVQSANVLFNSNLSSSLQMCFTGDAQNFLSNSCIQSTADGYINLAFTMSEGTNTQKTISDLLQAIATDLADIAKPSTDPTTAVTTFESNLQVLLDIGNLTVSVIQTDLSQSGSLASYTLLDLSGLPSKLENAAISGLTLSGYVGKVLSLVNALGQISADVAAAAGSSETIVGPVLFSGGATLHVAQLVITSLDIAVELLPVVDTSLQTNQLYQWFATGVEVVTSFVDPSGISIKPSLFDSKGNLVLGYDSGTGTTTYSGPDGILILNGNGYLALLAENSTAPSNYSQTLNAIGSVSGALPYSVQLRSFSPTQAIQTYSGMLVTGNSVTIPVELNSTSGALLPETFLSPRLSVDEERTTVTVVAKAFLSDGSATAATDAFLILNGQQLAMTEVDASTFQITIDSTFMTPTPFTVYMTSPNIPGGYASGLLGVPQGVQLAASVSSITLDSVTQEYMLTVNIVNRGASVASDVMLTVADLDLVPTATKLPISVGSLHYGVTNPIWLVFPIHKRPDDQSLWLEISETYLGGTAEQVVRVRLQDHDDMHDDHTGDAHR